MAKFTVEEINMTKVCVSTDRQGMLQELLQLLPHLEGDMKELTANTINKLEKATEKEFSYVVNYPAEIFDEEEV